MLLNIFDLTNIRISAFLLPNIILFRFGIPPDHFRNLNESLQSPPS